MAARVPHLQDLLTHEYIQMEVMDRQTGKTICSLKSCRPTGYSTALSARNVEEITVNYVGLLVEDESGENAERADAIQTLG